MDIQVEGKHKSIRIKGEVANANRRGMGIEFQDVNDSLSEKLGNLLFKVL
jgi:hypothetical protein